MIEDGWFFRPMQTIRPAGHASCTACSKEEGIHTVYVIGKATLSKVDIIPVNFYVDDDDVEDILAEDDFDEEEAFPESGDVDVKVINKSEKEAVSEETVKSEDGFKPADNADTTEDNTETINLEEVK